MSRLDEGRSAVGPAVAAATVAAALRESGAALRERGLSLSTVESGGSGGRSGLWGLVHNRGNRVEAHHRGRHAHELRAPPHSVRASPFRLAHGSTQYGSHCAAFAAAAGGGGGGAAAADDDGVPDGVPTRAH